MRLIRSRRSLLPRLLAGLLALFVLLQLVPYGRAHTNPPVQAQPQWAEPETRELFARACADCHSHATRWPWYANVAPVSWLIQHHVDEGRGQFNVNVPGFGPEADEAAGQIERGHMPEPSYLPLHPGARLTTSETDQLVQGLRATFGAEEHAGGGH